MDPVTPEQTCAYSQCDRPVKRQGGQGAIPKIYCQPSCRSLAYRERSITSLEHPDRVLRGAVQKAHAVLDTEAVRDALPLAELRPDVRETFEKAKRALDWIAEQIPDTTE